MNLIDLIGDLKGKAKHWRTLLNRQEWIESDRGDEGWYNGYYDDAGRRSDETNGTSRMTLTGQVFPLIAGIVPAERVPKIVAAVRKHLTDPTTGLVRLNTDFGSTDLKLGRFAGFAYGHKENGAPFSHMAVMYAYGLYVAGFASEADAILDAQYAYMSDVDRSRILPGIPEYIDPHGRGVYHYLTGSAAWTMIAHVERLFGIRGDGGDFRIEPKLKLGHFVDGEASCAFIAGSRTCRLVVRNPESRDLGRYLVKTVEYDNRIYEINAATFNLSRRDCERGITVIATLGKAT
jgi:cellobiose phosphorylase